MLFRYLHENGPSPSELIATGDWAVLGEFVRCATDIAELREILGEQEERLPASFDEPAPQLVKDGPDLYRQSEQLAAAVRRRLGLGIDPIPSMTALVRDQLGVELFWVSPDDLDRDIDAACTRAPAPAILVNLVGGAERWWRTRMTLAHELCHLLFDADRLAAAASRRFFLFSPHRGESPAPARRPQIHLPDALELVERRANAFAAHLLSPVEGVRAAAGELLPTSDAAINAVCKRFGVGRVVAVNQLTHAYRLSKEIRIEMLSRPPTAVLPKRHPDSDIPLAGFRAGRLEDLALRAFAEGRIGAVRAREYLTLRLSDPLPEHPALSAEQRAPLHSEEHSARLAVQRWLAERRDLGACFPARVLREGDRYRVALEEATEAGARSAGTLVLSLGLDVLEGESSPEQERRWPLA